jgi:thiosulfate/3-mercaptopyruvate sulfurtransferase
MTGIMRRRQLISTEDLAQKLDHHDWRIVDCRFSLSNAGQGRNEYRASHIPGSVFMDLNEDLASKPTATSGRHPLPDVGTLAETIGRLGIDNQSEVVVYDADNGAMAARCWWIFRWLGHDKVRLLDGGLAAWKEGGFPLSADIPGPRARRFDAKTRVAAVITGDELMDAMGTNRMPRVFDARDTARFAGIVEPIDAVAGHVPGATSLPFASSLGPGGRWRNQSELESLWRQHLGADRRTAWVAMCGSGVTACHLALSAVEAGFSEPRLYVGSWSEWIRDKRRPIATGPV